MSENLFNTPLWIVAPIIVLSSCGLALLGLNLVRRLIVSRLRISHEDSEFTGTMVQSVMVFYGLAVALIAVSVWETHSAVADTVSLEASRLAGLYRDTGGYPDPLRSELHGELKAYLDVVVNEEWPAQRRGEHPTGGVEWMDRFQTSMNAFQPETTAQEILHGEAFHEFNLLVEARRLRLDAMLTKLSPVLWIMIVVGAAISLASTFFFKVEDPTLHRIQVLLVAGFMGMVITLIFAFDRPFHGDLAVDPGPYEFIQEQLMTD